jgi:hypothetical protein
MFTPAMTKEGKERSGYFCMEGFEYLITKNSFDSFFQSDINFRTKILAGTIDE